MTYVYPDFYTQFHCVASSCRHNCCKGWEIDIDSDSLKRYKKVDGALGRELKEKISCNSTPHFILNDDESCPFLREDGLCRMIIELGEDSLCDICAEHPRFYNEYPERLETGLGLCCEEAARLLTDGTEPLKLIEETDGEPKNLTWQLELREKVFVVLSVQSEPLCTRMEKAMNLLGKKLLPFNCAETVRFYKTLERMDEKWGLLLDELLRQPDSLDYEQQLNAIRYERMAEYFIYRHFAIGESVGECAARLKFAFLSTRLICRLDALGAEDALRMYSAEIEYSDENVDAILSYIE